MKERERERERERKRERESLLRECTTRISSSSARLFIKKYPDTSPKNIFTHLAQALKRKNCHETTNAILAHEIYFFVSHIVETTLFSHKQQFQQT